MFLRLCTRAPLIWMEFSCFMLIRYSFFPAASRPGMRRHIVADAASGLFQPFGQPSGAAFADREPHRAKVVGSAPPMRGLLLLDHPHDVVHRHVGEADTDFAVHGPFDDPGRGDRRSDRFAVGGDPVPARRVSCRRVADHRYEAIRDSGREHLPGIGLPAPKARRRRWRGTSRRAAPAARRNSGAWRRSSVCATRRTARGSPPSVRSRINVGENLLLRSRDAASAGPSTVR